MSAWYLSTSSPSWKIIIVGTTTTLNLPASDDFAPISYLSISQSVNFPIQSISLAAFHPALKYFTSTCENIGKDKVISKESN